MAARAERTPTKRASRSVAKRTRRTVHKASSQTVGRSTAKKKTATRKWSAAVMRRSDAMDLEKGVFTKSSARAVALSLKRSVERSHRRKAPPFQSAMSMLNFEINRGGRNLSAARLRVLNNAKNELRRLFDRAAQ